MRFSALDSWRGLAAVMVVVFHFPGLFHGYGAPIVRNAYLFVDFFFVLSGFVVAHAYGERLSNWREFAGFGIRRFGRLWPLHATVLTGMLAFEAAKPLMASLSGHALRTPAFDPAGAMPLSALPVNLSLLHATGVVDRLTWNHPSWSIAAEFWTYLVFGLVSVLWPAFKDRIAAAMAVTAMTIVIANSKTGMDVTFDYGFARCLAGFFTGYLTYRAYTLWNRTSNERLSTVFEVSAILAVAIFVSAADRTLLSFAAPLVFAVAVYVFSLEGGLVSRALHRKPFQRLGAWSYAIYMVHVPLLVILTGATNVAEHHAGRALWIEVADGSNTLRVFDPGSAWIADAVLVAFLLMVVSASAIVNRWIEVPARAYAAGFAAKFDRTSLCPAQPSGRIQPRA